MEKYEEQDILEKKESIYEGPKKMLKLSDENGKFELTEVTYSRDSLDSKDSFLVDRGDALVIWVGKDASKNEKKYARFYAKKYITKEQRSSNLPIFVTIEGKKNIKRETNKLIEEIEDINLEQEKEDKMDVEKSSKTKHKKRVAYRHKKNITPKVNLCKY